MNFYNINNILKKNATYNLIIGERSNGKTYGVLLHALKQYFKNGSHFAYVRRWQEDIKGRRGSSLFNAHNVNNEVEKLSKGEYTGICFYNRRYYLCNYDDKGKPIYSDIDIIGYSFALSDSEHDKSTSYPKIKNIIFDEFITNKVYLNDEFVIFMNVLSTIIRKNTDVKIFMLGNTVNKYAPYFSEMGLNHISKQKQGTIDVYEYGNKTLYVAVEYCSTINKKNDESNKYYAFDNPKLSMITGGAWELDIFPHLPLKYKQSEVILIFFICFDTEIFQGNVIYKDDMLFIYIHKKTTEIKDTENFLIYTLEYNPKNNYSRDIFNPTNKMQAKIKELFMKDKVYFQDNSTGNSISNYIKACRG